MTQPTITSVEQARRTLTAGQQTVNVPMLGVRRGATGMFWRGGRAFGWLRDTNPDLLGFDVYDMMRRYPTIYAALTLRKAPILAQIKKASVVCEDEAIRAFVQRTFIDSGILWQVAVTSLRAFDFGVAFHEIEWQVGDFEISYTETDPTTNEETEIPAWSGPALVYKAIHEVNPQTVQEIRRRTEDQPGQNGQPGKPGDGSYDGFIQRGMRGKPPITVEAVNSFVYTRDLEFGNMWGIPLTRNAYPYFYWANAMLKLWMAWAERKVIPSRYVYFPQGETQFPDGTTVDNAEIALQTGNQIDGVTTVVIPSDPNDSAGARSWQFGELVTTDRTDIFDKILNFFKIEILHAMFTPERTFNEGQYGTKAEAETHFDTLLQVEDFDLFDLLDYVSKYLIGRLVAVNFGADSPPATLTAPGLTDDARALLHTILEDLILNPDYQARIDFEQVAEGFGVPLKQMADAAAPPADQGVNPDGTPTDTGQGPPPTDTTGTDATGTPSNLILDDDEIAEMIRDGMIALSEGDTEAMDAILDALEIVALAEKINLAQYQITEDPSSILGYKVMKNGKRLSGFAAKQVIKSWKQQAEKAQKASETAARKAAREAASAAKHQATAARTAANKAAREAAARARAAVAEQKKQARIADAAERRAAAAKTREARQQATTQAREARKAEHEAKAAERQAQHDQKAAERNQANTARDATRADAATVSAARTEKSSLESRTKAQTAGDAARTASAAGWDTHGGADKDRANAQTRAETLAREHPDRVYTLVQTKDGYSVISKPKDAINKTRDNRPLNVAADDSTDPPATGDDDGAGHDGSAPDDDTEQLWQRAAGTVAEIFRAADPTDEDPDDLPDDEG